MGGEMNLMFTVFVMRIHVWACSPVYHSVETGVHINDRIYMYVYTHACICRQIN